LHETQVPRGLCQTPQKQIFVAISVSVDSSKQYDTTRAYLKELDVITNVWIGLKKKGANDEFSWT
jgi:hypothetical protein